MSILKITTNNNNQIFLFDSQCFEYLISEDYNRIIDTIIQDDSGLEVLFLIAQKKSTTFPYLKGLKNLSISKIKAKDKSAVVEKVKKLYIQTFKCKNSIELIRGITLDIFNFINSRDDILENKHLFSRDVLSSDGEEFNLAIEKMTKYFIPYNISWFLKLNGYNPTGEQIAIIETYINKYNAVEKEHKYVKEEIENALKSVIKKEAEIEKKVSDFKSDIDKLNSDSVAIQSAYGKIKKQVDQCLSQSNGNLSRSTQNKDNIEVISKHNSELLDELSGYKKKNADTDKMIKQLNDKIDNLSEIIESVVKGVENCNQECKKLNDLSITLNDELNNVRNSVSSDNKLSFDSNNLLVEESVVVNTEIESGTFSEFSDCLDDAYRECGIKKCDPDYVTGVIASGTHPLFVGYRAREIAVITSLVLSGETPAIISLASADKSINLCDYISQLTSKVVLIEDCTVAMIENILYPLFRKYRMNKKLPFLLLSSEGSDDMELLPKHFYNHVSLIQCEDVDVNIKYDCVDSCCIKEVASSKEESQSFKGYKKIYTNVMKESDLDSVYINIKMNIFKYYSCDDITRVIKSMVHNEIKYISESWDNIIQKLGTNK